MHQLTLGQPHLAPGEIGKLAGRLAAFLVFFTAAAGTGIVSARP